MTTFDLQKFKQKVRMAWKSQVCADAPGHLHTVAQRVAYGHVVVIGHCCQHVKLSEEKCYEKNNCAKQPAKLMVFFCDTRLVSICGAAVEV